MQVTEFFRDEFPSFAVYNLYRMIGSYVDGLKPSSRKVVHTIYKHKDRIKVAQLSSEVAKETQYLHGENNLSGVIVGMAQNFPGSNNMALLEPLGSFGNRCIPEAAAPRYIHTAKSKNFEKLFNRDDLPLLTEQIFEGEAIEPMFFIPVLPLILINGSEGVGSGWSQKILPRNPRDLIKAIKAHLGGQQLPKRLKPYYEGYGGDIDWDTEKECWIFKGKFVRESTTRIRVTELPITYTLDKYNSILAELEDRKIISSFKDLSEPKSNKFEFVITARRDFLGEDDDVLIKKLKLASRVSENFTCMDENNVIREFKSEIEILQAFIEIRLEYYRRRKAFLINRLEQDVEHASARHRFVTAIIGEKIEVYRKSKKQIEEQLVDYPKFNDSFDYLLSMPIHSFTTETLAELESKVNILSAQRDQYSKMAPNDFWEADLK